MEFWLGYLHRMNGTASSEQITWWSIERVCEYLAMNEDQIGRLVRLHGLPHRDFGGVRRYPRELVEQWAEADIVIGERKPRARRVDAGRPVGVRAGLRRRRSQPRIS